MNKGQPPKWPFAFLRFYCRKDFLEEIEGDILEQYEIRRDEGNSNANLLLVLNVLTFLKWSNLKRPAILEKIKLKTHTIMIKNHFKMAFRSIQKNSVLSGVNILGLALAIGCSITAFLFIDMQLHMDNFHQKKDRIVAILSIKEGESNPYYSGAIPMNMATEIAEKNSFIVNSTRIQKDVGVLKSGQHVYNESIYFVDPSLLEIFDFGLSSGKSSCLRNADNIIISQQIADKYFSQNNPIGQILVVKFSNDTTKAFTVGAVFKEFPKNAAIRFDMVIPMKNYTSLYNIPEGALITASFLELTDKSEFSNLHPIFNSYLTEDAADTDIIDYRGMPLEQLALNGYKIRGAIAGAGHPVMRIGIGTLSFLILLLAAVNFLNISLVNSIKRLKEIGIRKAMGGSKATITIQILTENLLISLIAIILGTILCHQLFIPSFSNLVGYTIPFQFSSFTAVAGLYSGLLLTIAITACVYPAFYTSRFNSVHIMSKNVKVGKKSIFTKSLLAIQFAISFILLVACVLFTQNAIHFNNKRWGYKPEGIYAIHTSESSNHQLLRNKLSNISGITNLSGANQHVGINSKNSEVNINNQSFKVNTLYCQSSYPQTMGLKITEGSYPSTNQVILNQTAQQQLGNAASVGELIEVDGESYQVSGILSDFSFQSIHQRIEPLIIVANDQANYNYLVFKTSDSDDTRVIDQVTDTWYELNEYEPINLTYQSKIYDSFYKSNKSNAKITIFISFISILLVCMGVYGVVAFNIERKLKEFSIRKTLGASEMTILKIISKSFGYILIGTFLFSLPVGIKVIQSVVSNSYPDAQPFTIYTALSVLLIMSVFVALTLGFKMNKAMKINPAENLRNE